MGVEMCSALFLPTPPSEQTTTSTWHIFLVVEITLLSFLSSSRTRARRFFFFRSKSFLAHHSYRKSWKWQGWIPLVSFRVTYTSYAYIFLLLLSNFDIQRARFARNFIYHKLRHHGCRPSSSSHHNSRIYRTYIESRQCFVCILRAFVLSSLVFALFLYLCHITRTPFILHEQTFKTCAFVLIKEHHRRDRGKFKLVLRGKKDG